MTKKKGIIAIIVVILIIISGAYYWYTKSNETKKDDYTLGTVARSNIGLSIDATGTIEPVNSVDGLRQHPVHWKRFMSSRMKKSLRARHWQPSNQKH